MLIELLPPPLGRTGWPWTIDIPAPDPSHSDIDGWPKISIVTSSFNQGKFIEETIRSVLLQGYPNLEYLIIDGGSTDQTIEIIKRYEKHITFWISVKDKGQSAAINKGLRRATGDIYGWINSDDWLAPGTLCEAARSYQACLDKHQFWIVFAIECIDEVAGKRTIASQVPANDLDDWLVKNAQVNQQGSPPEFSTVYGLWTFSRRLALPDTMSCSAETS